MKRIALLVAATAWLVGCGTLSNTAESPTFHGRASGKAAVVTVECDHGVPYTGAATASADAMKTILGAKKINVAAPSDPALVCSTYGKGTGGVDGFTVPAEVASMIRETAKVSGAESVLVNVAAYDRHCSDNEPKCDKSIVGATVREILFSADGAQLWTKWDFAAENKDEAESTLIPMYADVPADKLITASTAAAPKSATPTPMIAAAVPPPAPAAPEPAPETSATILATMMSDVSAACVSYAKATCDKGTLEACHDAVDLVNSKPSAKACKALTKKPSSKSKKVATR
jgi:hypothetical protein